MRYACVCASPVYPWHFACLLHTGAAALHIWTCLYGGSCKCPCTCLRQTHANALRVYTCTLAGGPWQVVPYVAQGAAMPLAHQCTHVCTHFCTCLCTFIYTCQCTYLQVALALRQASRDLHSRLGVITRLGRCLESIATTTMYTGGRADARTDGRTNGRTDGRADARTRGRTRGRMRGCRARRLRVEALRRTALRRARLRQERSANSFQAHFSHYYTTCVLIAARFLAN